MSTSSVSFRIIFASGILISFNLACTPSSGSRTKESSDGVPAQLTITGPISDMIYTRIKDVLDDDGSNFQSSYRDVQVSYGDRTISAKLRTRGGARFCNAFPPFKLKLSKGETLGGHSKLKLGNDGLFTLDPSKSIHAPECDNTFNNFGGAAALGLEITLMELAEQLLPHHLEVKRSAITFKDPQAGLELQKDSYLLESPEHAAARYGGTEYKMENPAPAKDQQLAALQDFDQEALMDGIAFRVLILDRDWTLLGLNSSSFDPNFSGIKNFETIRAAGKIIALPYDFNFSEWILYSAGKQQRYQSEVAMMRAHLQANFTDGLAKAFDSALARLAAKLEDKALTANLPDVARNAIAAFQAALKAGSPSPRTPISEPSLPVKSADNVKVDSICEGTDFKVDVAFGLSHKSAQVGSCDDVKVSCVAETLQLKTNLENAIMALETADMCAEVQAQVQNLVNFLQAQNG
ncbi:MAG: hypothetical protein NTX25_16355 [Proteobacteria bacterium]|nr:hypothetical protein [Pseudomonadota bacterium]